MLTITEKAARKALELAEKQGKAPSLRVGVRGGGCSGFSYFLDFDDTPRPDDSVWSVAGLTVRCDPKSLTILDGTTVDYSTSLMQHGFRFDNPRVKRRCGCGESFSMG